MLEANAAAALDDDLEENYKDKLGRWIRDAIAALGDVRFGQYMVLNNVSRRPSNELLYSLQKAGANGECYLSR